jgi:GTP-binding protein HflX
MSEAPSSASNRKRCIVVHPRLRAAHQGDRDDAARLDEAIGLARAIDLEVVAAETINLASIHPATLFGGGTVARLAGSLGEFHDSGSAVTVAIVDAAVTPVQQRNLEKAWNTKVLDRTGLILEIFGERARTREGEMQVELAALNYQKSRLVRSWTHLERQRGGFGFFGGPGESQIETDRRLIRNRIARLKRDLSQVRRTRELHRRARKRVPYPVVALVGYTNAGKSTLFNRLTHASVAAQDLLFATLDPTMRALALPSGGRVIVSDTVGFISDLPHELVEAFRATLEEVVAADLIVHVRDVSHPKAARQKADVETVLRSLGLAEVIDAGGMIEALNKKDLLPEEEQEPVANRAARAHEQSLLLSAITGEGCDQLVAAIDARLAAGREIIDIDLAAEDGAGLAWLYRHGEVLERSDQEGILHLRVRLSPADAARFSRHGEKTAETAAGG